MENPEELLQSLEEFSKVKPRHIPDELEGYLIFVAQTGDPVYQWPTIKTLFRQKLINVITNFYQSCDTVEIPVCPNVELFNFDTMKNFILEKLDTFVAAPFTVQRICELLTNPRKEYNRLDKYMRALEKNILVVSTMEPGGRHGAKNGDSVMNGIDSEHIPESSHCNNDINVEEMDETPAWKKTNSINENTDTSSNIQTEAVKEENLDPENKEAEACNAKDSTVIATRSTEESVKEEPYVSIEPVIEATCTVTEESETSSSVTITAVPAGVQKRRSSVEPEVNSEGDNKETTEIIEGPKEPVKETNEAENKLEEVVKDEDRIILTSTDSGIENISPESSTSSPENLQNEFESCTESTAAETFTSSELPEESNPSIVDSSNANEPMEDVKVNEVIDQITEEKLSKDEETLIISESVQAKDFEVSSSVTEDPKGEVSAMETVEESAEVKVEEKIEESQTEALKETNDDKAKEVKIDENDPKTETPMDVDSSSDTTEMASEVNSVSDV